MLVCGKVRSVSAKLILILVVGVLLNQKGYSQGDYPKYERESFERFSNDKYSRFRKLALFKSEKNGAFKAKLPSKIGKKIIEVTFDSLGSSKEILFYNAFSTVEKRYEFQYPSESELTVNKYETSTRLSRTWEYQDSVLTKESIFNKDGRALCEWLFTYNDDNLIAKIEEHQEGYGLTQIQEYKYDDNLDELEYIEVVGKKVTFRRVTERNNVGEIIGIKTFDADSVEISSIDQTLEADTIRTRLQQTSKKKRRYNWTIDYKYEDGNVVAKTYYNVKGKVSKSMRYQYRDSNLINETHYNRKGKTKLTIDYDYNDTGQLTRISRGNGSLETQRIEFIFDDNDEILDKKVYVRASGRLQLGLHEKRYRDEDSILTKTEELYPLLMRGVVYTYIYE